MDLTGEAVEGSLSKGTLNRIKGSSQLCIPESDVKYQMTRVSLENISLFLVETGCACNLEVGDLAFEVSESSGGCFIIGVSSIKRLGVFLLLPPEGILVQVTHSPQYLIC